MTKKLYYGASFLALSAISFTSCLNGGGNSQTLGGLFGTVTETVNSDMTKTLVQLDVNGLFYYAEEFKSTDTPLQNGDRVYLQQMTLDYDNQAPGATGLDTAPMKMTAVTWEEVDTKMIVPSEEDGLPNDSLPTLAAPYIIHHFHKGIITFQGLAPEKSLPEFRLVYVGSRQAQSGLDTLEYALRTEYKNDDYSNKVELFNQCFKLNYPSPQSEQPVLINYTAKRFDSNNLEHTTDSTFLMKYPKFED